MECEILHTPLGYKMNGLLVLLHLQEEEEEEDYDEESDDDTAALLAELEKIKKERAEEQARKVNA